MEFIKTFEGFLNEIGDALVNPFNYKFKSNFANLDNYNSVIVNFTTDEDVDYTVTIKNIDMFVDINFYSNANLFNKYALTNKGDIFKVMSTLVKIIQDFLLENKEIRGIRYEPMQKGRDGGKGRDRLYRLFIPKVAESIEKNVKFTQNGNTVFATFI